MGYDKFLSKANAETLDEDRDTGGPRRLMRVPLGDDEPLCLRQRPMPVDRPPVRHPRPPGNAILPPGHGLGRRFRQPRRLPPAGGNVRMGRDRSISRYSSRKVFGDEATAKPRSPRRNTRRRQQIMHFPFDPRGAGHDRQQKRHFKRFGAIL